MWIAKGIATHRICVWGQVPETGIACGSPSINDLCWKAVDWATLGDILILIFGTAQRESMPERASLESFDLVHHLGTTPRMTCLSSLDFWRCISRVSDSTQDVRWHLRGSKRVPGSSPRTWLRCSLNELSQDNRSSIVFSEFGFKLPNWSLSKMVCRNEQLRWVSATRQKHCCQFVEWWNWWTLKPVFGANRYFKTSKSFCWFLLAKALYQ